MPLTATDWCIRVGVNPGLIGSLPDQAEGLRRIGELILWRYPAQMADQKKLGWMKAVWPKVMVRAFERTAETPFWEELYSKKFGLYGQSFGSDSVPEKLIRHPWSLRAAEFKSALEAIVVDGVIPTVNDDRAHVSAVLGGTAGVLGLATFAGAATGIPAVIAGAVAGGIAVKAELQSISEQAHISKNLPAFVEIYKREAAYRSVEIPVQSSPVMP